MSMPRTMTAAILVEQRKPLVVDQVEMPESLDVGQVAVKLLCSGICGSQLGEIDGAKGEDRFLPHLLGHEGAGEVLQVGPGVRTVAPGDRVVLHWRKAPGIEAAPPKYRWQGNVLNAGWVTTFNEYAVVSENRLTRVPQDVEPEIAALFGCAVTTGFGVVTNNARLTIGESVVVYGAGGVGLNIIQAAAMVSAHPIVAVDLHPRRLELARKMGATHVVDASAVDPATAIRDALEGAPLDVFIDNTGSPAVIESGYGMLSATGRLVLVGVPRKGNDITIHSLPLHFGKSVSGSHGGEARPEEDIPRYLKLHRDHRLRLADLVTDRFHISRVNEAIAGMRDGSVQGRCILEF